MAIYVNQVGYYTQGQKKATIKDCKSCVLYKDSEPVEKYTVDQLYFDENSEDMVATIDFSSITEPGKYHFLDDNGSRSCSFEISDRPYDKLLFDSLKMFYFQRCGMELEEKYAGIYTHKACHTKKVTLMGTDIECDCIGGWHDAGDYGRYTTAGAVAVAQLLYAYELCRKTCSIDLNIPETGNGIPDILNEVKYELDFFLQMIDKDGGVYHKCTSWHHAAFVMPEDDLLPFIITPVSSMATADACGVFALASRLFREFDPDYAALLEEKAKLTFNWLINNPDFLFKSPDDVHTGGYHDRSDVDERIFAYTEMYLLTGDKKCLELIDECVEKGVNFTALGWGDVAGFSAIAALTAGKDLFDEKLLEIMKSTWLKRADELLEITNNNHYNIAFIPVNFGWGSNMVVMHFGMIMCLAHHLTGEQKYLNGAISQLDYILGRNALDTSYVTGHGEKAFRNPHNRPTASDGIDDPIPGYVSGGPNRNPVGPMAREMTPEGTPPMKSFADVVISFSTNEITIYWNSPFVYTLAYIKEMLDK